MRRLGGLAAALLLVAAGLGIRAWRDDDVGAGDRTGGGGEPALRCVPELADVCRAVDPGAVIEPAADTFAELTAAGADVVPWVTVSPWPAMVDDERRRSGLAPLFDDAETLAATELVWIGWTERLAVLESDCGLDWDCLVADADWSAHGGPAGWGRVQVGVLDPAVASDTVRTLVWESGLDDGRVASDPEVDRQLRRLADRIPDLDPPAGSAVAQMLVTGPAGFDVAVAPRALAEPLVAGSARADQLDVVTVDPGAVVGAVAGGPGIPSLAGELRDRLLAEGWVAPGGLEGRPVDGGQAIAVWLAFDQVTR